VNWKYALILAGLASLLTLPFRGPAQAAPEIFASPVQAGCYRATRESCKIHVEPFTINLASGTKLVYFKLLAVRAGASAPGVIYDFRPDLSNPVPFLGSAFTPSLVAKDFAAQCGQSYALSLQGQDTGDPNPFSLGLTGQFACPQGDYQRYLPLVSRR
jgi:hypothetical protein